MYPARSDAAMVLLVEHIEEQGYEAVVLFDISDDRGPGEGWVIVTDWASPCWTEHE